jgi:hypothetical protein
VDIVASIVPRKPYHFHGRNCIMKCISVYSSLVNVLGILTTAALQYQPHKTVSDRNLMKLQGFQLEALALTSITILN